MGGVARSAIEVTAGTELPLIAALQSTWPFLDLNIVPPTERSQVRKRVRPAAVARDDVIDDSGRHIASRHDTGVVIEI
jgi:hypothetical protein